MNQQQQPMYVPQMKSIAERVNNMPRLVQCIQAHNEEEFIGLTLRSVYNEVDKILVIEGAVKNRPDSTEDGHSIDKTIEIIEDFKANHDPDKKVTFLKIRRHWKNLEEMKQTFLDMCMPGDIVLINDADEFYRPKDVERIREFFNLQPHATELIVSMMHFYKDFYHVAKPGPEWSPNPQRIFKYTEGMKFNQHPVASDAAGRCTYFSPEYQPRRFVPSEPILMYHYSFARNNMNEVMEKKQEYYSKELSQHNNADKPFNKKVDDWFDNSEEVLRFDGEHPEIINGHSMFSVHTQEDLNVVGEWREDDYFKLALSGGETGNIWLCMSQQSQPFMQHYHNGMEIGDRNV